MELQLDGKVAIITGGSKGIGRATALAMLAEGAAVLVCARGQEALDETIAAASAPCMVGAPGCTCHPWYS